MTATACLFAPSLASAQSSGSDEIAIELSAQLRHDSNVARADTARAALRGLVRSDERLTLGASLIVDRSIGALAVELDAFAGYDFYRRNSGLDRERIQLDGRFDYEFGPCAARLLPSFRRGQSELSDLAVLNTPGLDSVRNTQTEQIYRGELACGRKGGLRPAAFYEQSRGDNSNVLRRFSDFRAKAFGLGAEYDNPVLGRYAVSAKRQDLDYPNRATGPLSMSSGYRLDQLALEGSREIGAILTAEFGVGYAHLKPNSPTVPDFEGISWQLAATATPMPAARLKLSTSQVLTPTLSSESVYTRTRNFGIDATYALSYRTSAGISLGRANREHRGATALLGPLLTNDRLDKIAARVDFKPGNRLSFGLEAGHERRNANGTFYDYRNNFVALQTRFTLGR